MICRIQSKQTVLLLSATFEYIFNKLLLKALPKSTVVGDINKRLKKKNLICLHYILRMKCRKLHYLVLPLHTQLPKMAEGTGNVSI